MRKVLAIVSFILIFLSCSTQKSITNLKELDFDKFTIMVPNSWKKVKVKGIDSYVGRIRIDSKHTVEFDLGFYSNALSDYTKKTKVSWDIIDGYRAKIVVYEGSQSDITGVYVDSLSGSHGDIRKFNIYGKNLNIKNQVKFLNAIKTLKFHKRNL